MIAASGREAFAHASDRGHVLLLPTGYYVVGGALAVAASFVVLLVLPPHFLERFAAQRLPLFRLGTAARPAVSLAAFALLAVLVAAGFLGSRDPLSNPLPLVIWTLLWVGLTLAQGVLGNLWAWINPWLGPYWLISYFARRKPAPLPVILRQAQDGERGASALRQFPFSPYVTGRRSRHGDGGPQPQMHADHESRLSAFGYWPAVILFFAFAWFELIYPAPDDPARLALVVSLYWLANFLCMLLFGYETWSSRGECLSVFFGMIGRLSIFEHHKTPEGTGELRLCWPGAKLQNAAPLPLSGVLFLLLALASVSFDGFSRTFFWLGLNGINPLEFPGRSALVAINTGGLALTFAVLSTVFLLAIFLGSRLVRDTRKFLDAAGLLVWSIVPIALAYHFSHYLTMLLVNSQYALVALSDPFSRGWDLFGTANFYVAPGVVMGADTAWTIWNLQAGAIIGGHVLAVLIAHMLAARLHPLPARAVISQAPLTLLMIAYTVFGLWLVSTPTAG